jgi:hypothetical protein
LQIVNPQVWTEDENVKAHVLFAQRVFLEDLLVGVMQTPYVLEDLRHMHRDEGYRDYAEAEIKERAIEHFFNQELSDVLAFEPIWKWLKEQIRSDLERAMHSVDEFVYDGMFYQLETATEDKLHDLAKELIHLQRKQLESR